MSVVVNPCSENFLYQLRNKTFSVPSQPGVNRGKRLGEFQSRSVKIREAVEGFRLLENSHKLCRGFQQTMEAQTTYFICFIKLFSVLTKRKTIYEARTVNSHNSETFNHISHVIFVLHSAMKTHHVLFKLFYNTL